MLKKILNVVFWVLFVILLSIWLIDFIKIRNEKDPIFCIKKKTHEFEDGTVNECLGLGYRIYNYNRSSLPKGIDFAPFFVKMREPNK